MRYRILHFLFLISCLCFGPCLLAKGNSASIEFASISLDQLPAQAIKTLELIRKGGPFPYPKDGVVFGNREKVLPKQVRGYYTEYTVKTPGSRDRGARRIVAGGDPKTSGEYYYTDNPCASFKRIVLESK
jgi:ribonuclease T1